MNNRPIQHTNILNKDECNYLDVTRFIGIYLVIMAHFIFSYRFKFLCDFIFTFHMPLFFIISGILHQVGGFTWKKLGKLVVALIVPYLLYSLLALTYLWFTRGQNFDDLLVRTVNTLLVYRPVSVASWFLIALFWIKFIALFLPSRRAILITSMACIVLIAVLDSFTSREDYAIIFMLRPAILAFPFFGLGFLLKDFIHREYRNRTKILILVLLFAFNVFLFLQFGTLSIALLNYNNLFVIYLMGTAGSLSVIYLSQLLAPYLNFNFIKDISRGTMMIVGLHTFVMYEMFPTIFFGTKSLREIAVLSTLLMLVFYIIIKLTYNRVPILYGKWKR